MNFGLNRAAVIEETFINVGKPMLRRLNVAPGDVVGCLLAPVDPDQMLVPDDVAQALKDGPG